MKQSGNVLFFILIAVALFAALSYAVTQSSSGGGGNISKEQAKLDQAVLENYLSAINTGVTRLTIARGCDTVDYTPPAAWIAGDKSCHLYHPDGAGVSYRDFDFDACPDGTPLVDLNIGDSCLGIVYIGVSDSNRIYAATTDNGSMAWGPRPATTGATSSSDGLANTDDLIAYDDSNGTTHAAAQSCRSLGPKWYLPATNELKLLSDNSTLQGGTIDLASIGITLGEYLYWTSNEHNQLYSYALRFDPSWSPATGKHFSRPIRCVRRD